MKSDSNSIHPTGTCFEDITLAFVDMLTSKQSRANDPTFYMVHGICLLKDGSRYSHAWIEEDGHVWFSGKFDGQQALLQTSRKDFYKEFRVQECTKYNHPQLIRTALEHGDAPPPWEKKYLMLCNDYKGNKK